MNRPLVSIVTPSFNQGQFIEDCIVSVKNQTYKDMEHIIVDGGSRDKTLNIIKRHEGTYNMQWISETDRGMYFAINKGMAMTKGEIIAYLNCDDLYFPWSVGVAVKNLFSKNSPDMIYGDLLNLKLYKVQKRSTLKFYPKFNPYYYKTVGIIGQPAVFWKRKAFKECGFFNTNYKLIADCDYWLRANQKGLKIKKIEEFLAIERDHEGMQREAKKEILKEEMDKLRSVYGTKNSWICLFLKMYGKLNYRFYLLKFLLTNLGWPYFRQSPFLKGKFRSILFEILPRGFKQYNYFITEAEVLNLIERNNKK